MIEIFLGRIVFVAENEPCKVCKIVDWSSVMGRICFTCAKTIVYISLSHEAAHI